MLRSRVRSRAFAVLFGFICLGVAAYAAAGTDDRGAADSALKEVAASPKKDVAGEMVARSKAALDRGAQLRTKGDEKHALLADALAKTWAEAARDAVKAAVVEDTAAKARQDATDAGLISDRERSLLEEAVAESGRLRAQLEASPTKDQPAKTSAQANSDAGAPRKATKGDAGAGAMPANEKKNAGASNLDGGAP